MQLFKHNQSNKVYQVLPDEATATEITYRAVGNGGKRFRLTPAAFRQKMTQLTTPQAQIVATYLIELETYNDEVNMTLINQIAQILNGADPEGELEELFQHCDSGPGKLIRPKQEFSRIALDESILTEVEACVVSIQRRRDINEDFQLNAICEIRRSVYCFYGPPGTGKTITAIAIAKRLGKLLYQVDYSEITSSAGRREIFRRAARYNAILFLDEADALCAARTFWPSATAQRLNVDKNVFIQALDQYDGPVLMSTNLLSHFDLAMMRRLSRAVKFTLPTRQLRVRLFELHFPNDTRRVQVDFDQAAGASDDLSGGDIQNACFNAIDAACISAERANWCVTTEHVVSEIEKIKRAKADNMMGNPSVRNNGRSAEPAEVTETVE